MPARIQTSSWFVELPETHVRVGISRGTPRGLSGFRRYDQGKLAPGPWFKSADESTYRDLYFRVLAGLDAQRVVDDLEALGDGRVPTLVCFEPPEPEAKWCHRGYVAAWLHDKLGLAVTEFGQEHCGAGWRHPKIPLQFRERDAEDCRGEILGMLERQFDSGGETWMVVGPDTTQHDLVVASNGRRRVRFPVGAVREALRAE